MDAEQNQAERIIATVIIIYAWRDGNGFYTFILNGAHHCLVVSKRAHCISSYFWRA